MKTATSLARAAACAILAGTLSVLAPPRALAAGLAGVTLPDHVEAEGKSLVLNGLGLRKATLFKVSVYVAGLYLEEKSSDPQRILEAPQVKRIVMQFVRGVGRKDLVKAWQESFAENAPAGMAPLQPRVDTLNSFMSDVAKGESIAFTYAPGKGVTVEMKGQGKGPIPGEDFARALFGIWLGPKPPNPDLKSGLLGGA